MASVVVFMLAAALGDVPAREVRNRELLSSVIISGSCVRGCAGDRRLFGTGEIVARRDDGRLVVLTANHVVDGMGEPHVYVRNGTPEGTPITTTVRNDHGIEASVIARSPELDLALVSFRPHRDDAYGIAPLAASPVQSGNVVGGPYGALWTVSPYRALPPVDDATLVSCATCGPGDSGGGVFDGRGALAGILVSQQVLVNDNEPPAAAARTTRFKIVALDDVRTFVTSLPPQTAAPLVADPWSRFDRQAGDPWSRFGRGGGAAQ